MYIMILYYITHGVLKILKLFFRIFLKKRVDIILNDEQFFFIDIRVPLSIYKSTWFLIEFLVLKFVMYYIFALEVLQKE